MKHLALSIFVALVLLATPAAAQCVNPDGVEGVQVYNATYHVMQYCNGDKWIGMGGGSAPDLDAVLNAGNAAGGSVITGLGAPMANADAATKAYVDSVAANLLPVCPPGESIVMGAGGWQCTGGGDTTPDAFSFNDVTAAPVSTLAVPSPASIAIAGITAPTPVSVSGQGSPQISIDGGPWIMSGTIASGQTLAVRLTSAAAGSTTHSAAINVGGMTDTWSVTTIATPPCAGVSVGGYCWYKSASNKSCDDACVTHAGCDLAGTRDYAGSAGSNANCLSVLDALGGTGAGAVSDSGFVFGTGCAWDGSNQRFPATSPATNCNAYANNTYRACACNE